MGDVKVNPPLENTRLQHNVKAQEIPSDGGIPPPYSKLGTHRSGGPSGSNAQNAQNHTLDSFSEQQDEALPDMSPDLREFVGR